MMLTLVYTAADCAEICDGVPEEGKESHLPYLAFSCLNFRHRQILKHVRLL